MSTTKEVSRRAIISGAAALPAVAMLPAIPAAATVNLDPIFAAIAAHRSAWAALSADCSRLDEACSWWKGHSD